MPRLSPLQKRLLGRFFFFFSFPILTLLRKHNCESRLLLKSKVTLKGKHRSEDKKASCFIRGTGAGVGSTTHPLERQGAGLSPGADLLGVQQRCEGPTVGEPKPETEVLTTPFWNVSLSALFQHGRQVCHR